MEHIAALLLIVSCTGGTTDCRELPAPAPFYEAMDDCRADLDLSLQAYRPSHPELHATCVDVDPALEESDAELVWDIDSRGALQASIQPLDLMVAADQSGHTIAGIRHE